MIEANARVVSLEGASVWLEPYQQSACGACTSTRGCAAVAVAGLFGRRRIRLRALNRVGAAVGEDVVIGVEDTVLLRSAFAVYAAPLAGLIAGGVLGHSVASGAEGITILMSLAGLALGVLGGDRQNRSWQRVLRCQPVVLRRVGGGPHEALANEQGG